LAWVDRAEDAHDLPNVLASHSLNRRALDAHLHLYQVVMFGESELSRVEREAIAVAVSAVNECHY
jgi:alkylhydroperoxidase family enzyme